MTKRCEGWRRHGGAFSLGPVKWTQCENPGVVMLTVEQEGTKETFPCCMVCWQEAIDNKIKILDAVPIAGEKP